MIRIDKLAPGTVVELAFHSRSRVTAPWVQDCTFVDITGVGDERRATFVADDTGNWDAYRFDGHWAWGSGADRLQLLNVR